MSSQHNELTDATLNELKAATRTCGVGNLLGLHDWQMAIGARVLQPVEQIYRVATSGADFRIATNRRVVAVDGTEKKPRLASYWYEAVEGVNPTRGFLNSGVGIVQGGQQTAVYLDGKHVEPFVEAIKDGLEGRGPRPRQFWTPESVQNFIRSETGMEGIGLEVLSHRVLPEEELHAVAGSQCRGVACAILVTNLRLAIGPLTLDGNLDIDLAMDELRGTDITPGIWHSRLSIRANDDRYDFTWAHKGDAERIASAVEALLLSGPDEVGMNDQDYGGEALTAPSIAEELERLAALHRSRLLTDEEFARAKAKVLGA